MHAPASILVVEDEPQLRGLLRLYLEREGHRVTDAGDGPTALAAFDADPPDLVILDLMLPGLDGPEVCRQLQTARPVPVPTLTARASATEQRCAGTTRPDGRRGGRAAPTAPLHSRLSEPVGHTGST